MNRTRGWLFVRLRDAEQHTVVEHVELIAQVFETTEPPGFRGAFGSGMARRGHAGCTRLAQLPFRSATGAPESAGGRATGVLPGSANRTYHIDFFASERAHASGAGEGQR